MTYIYHVSSPVGMLHLASDGEHLTGLWIEGQKYFKDTLAGDEAERMVPVFEKSCQWLNLYFAGQQPDFVVPLAPAGTSFRQSVWEILCAIPYGQVITYGEIARRLEQQNGGRRVSAQAVGGAVGHNPISIIIPCHRVVGAGGNLTGYAGGIDKKIRLLKLEGVHMEDFFVPKTGTAL